MKWARVWALAAVTLFTVAAALPAGAATPAHAASPVGTWKVKVHLGAQTYDSGVRFTPGGHDFLTVFDGAGTWTPTGANTFTYHIAEPMFQPDGAYRGWVDIDQRAVLTGNTFSSWGISTVYDAGDHVITSVLALDDGARS